MNFLAKLLLLTSLCIGTTFAAVDINIATQSELESVKGLGPTKAKAIVAHREKNGPYKSLDDLDAVKGFGKASIDRLRGELTVGKVGSDKPASSGQKKP